jgi:hypothetical protein
MFELLAILHLSNALAIFLGCRPRTLTIPLIEEDGPTWIIVEMRQCLLVSSRLDLELLTSSKILLVPTITSCCARVVFVGTMKWGKLGQIF